MGFYLNSLSAYTLYKNELSKPYFIDKTELIAEMIPLVESGSDYICITRPRRFGKTMAASMLGVFFSKSCDSHGIFDNLNIAQSPKYSQHINQYNVIYIDFSDIDDECKNYTSYIQNIKELLRDDLHTMYPEVKFRKNGSISEDLKRIYAQTQTPFIFILDEWDAIFHIPFIKEPDKQSYLRFLKGMLKGKEYISLAYMTGILPIAKYSSGSELNMFLEYTMTSEGKYNEYFGFTDTEVNNVYDRYLSICKEPQVTREGLKLWYDGYHTRSGERVYNPRSVVASLTNNNLGNYWTSSGPYDEIFYYTEKNINDVRDSLALMVSGESIDAKIQEYAATSMNLKTKDEIWSAMVVYGFLTSEHGKVFIPNKELMGKFEDMLLKEPSLGYVYNLSKASDQMLKATIAGDTDAMADILEFAHDTESPLLDYNNEIELTAVVNLTYLSARDHYRIEREDKARTGYVDFIFYPKDYQADCIILELKTDHTPEEAIQQIKDRKYALKFKGRLGEKPQYSGRILAVGIAYDRTTKHHSCKVEVLK